MASLRRPVVSKQALLHVLRPSSHAQAQSRFVSKWLSQKPRTDRLRLSWAALGLLGAGGGASLVYALEHSVDAGDLVLHPQKLPWSHNGFTEGLDYASVRRGWQVYKNVCAACHSLEFIAYRHFVEVFMTKDEAKAEAAEHLFDDIDDEGKEIKRPGTLLDYLPNPYKNAVAAKVANGGALPPDLSLIVMGRHGCEDYIFSILTGYVDAPAGVDVEEGKAYNPYFAGGIISMPQQLFDEGIEYDDGTPATMSQQAKDVVTFLRWTATPYWDRTKTIAWTGLAFAFCCLPVMMYIKMHTWSMVKSQQFAFRTVMGREKPKELAKASKKYYPKKA